jgi:predicted nucleotidyltransferase
VPLPSSHQRVVDRFVAACESDRRVVVALLVGSNAAGRADPYSDLDLCVVTVDDAHAEFLAEREQFVRSLGEPIFLEDFDLPDMAFFVLADGAEIELVVAKQSELHQLVNGPYRALMDRDGSLSGVTVVPDEVDEAKQTEQLRRLIQWFWHDLAHFVAAVGRGQLWWGHGQLEVLRRICVNLARLHHDFSAAAEGYDKVDHAITAEALRPLQATFCQLDRTDMLEAAAAIVAFYRDLATALAQQHGLDYPESLDRLVSGRLEELSSDERLSG